jgi:hypothetical protein
MAPRVCVRTVETRGSEQILLEPPGFTDGLVLALVPLKSSEILECNHLKW